MQGKTVVVTGATQGIGLVTARELAVAKAGARVIFTARDAVRGQEVKDEIQRSAGHDRVEMVLIDFADQASIRAGADEIKRRTSRIDVLINNAGAIYQVRKTTAEGHEFTFAVNHLGYFLLTNLFLLDVIKRSAPARIVSVSSDAHRFADVDFDDIMGERGWTPMKSYGQSKLCNILFTRELARRLQGTGVTANCLHPGVIASGFGRNDGGLMSFL